MKKNVYSLECVNGIVYSNESQLYHSASCYWRQVSQAEIRAIHLLESIAINLGIDSFSPLLRINTNQKIQSPCLLKKQKNAPTVCDLMFQKSPSENKRPHKVSTNPVTDETKCKH